MLIFFSLHFLKDLGGRRVVSFQSRREVGVNARICFLGRDREREDFLFRQVPEIFGHGMRLSFVTVTTCGPWARKTNASAGTTIGALSSGNRNLTCPYIPA